MNHKRAKQRELFSIEEANAMLPLVRAILTDLTELSRDIIERRQRLTFLLAGRNPNDHDVYQEELVQVDQELEKDSRRLHDYREELRALGVEAKNGPEGFVDFPAILDERKVCLCWNLGEPEIVYWHDLDDDCADRHLLTADTMVGGMAGETMDGQQ